MDQYHLFNLTDAERDRFGKAMSEISYDPHGSMRYITDLRIMALLIIPRRVIDVLSEQRASFKG